MRHNTRQIQGCHVIDEFAQIGTPASGRWVSTIDRMYEAGRGAAACFIAALPDEFWALDSELDAENFERFNPQRRLRSQNDEVEELERLLRLL